MAMVLLPLLVGVAAFAMFSDWQIWRFEWAQALDRAGLYLFLTSPFLAGIAAWETVRWRRWFATVSDGLPSPGLIARMPWMSVAAVGVTFHCLVLVTHSLIAAMSGAIGAARPLPVALQMLSICGACAAGGFLGTVSSSVLIAPAVTAGSLLLNTMFPGAPFRRIVDMGAGFADFIGWHYTYELLFLRSAIFLGFVLAMLPLRRLKSGTQRGVSVAGLACALVAAMAVAMLPLPELTPTAEASRQVCVGAAPQICGPPALAEHLGTIAAQARVAERPLRDAAVASLPTTYVIGPGADIRPTRTVAVLPFEPAMLHYSERLRRAVHEAVSSANFCSELTSNSASIDELLDAGSTIKGWLLEEFDDRASGMSVSDVGGWSTYPEDLVARIRAKPPAEQYAIIRQLYAAVRACDPNVSAESLLGPR
jgi:hypothetical protein